MRLVIIAVICVIIAGCEPIARTNEKVNEESMKQVNEVRKLENTFKINGKVTLPTLGEVPVSFKIDQREAEETVSKEDYTKSKESEKDITLPAVEQGTNWLATLIGIFAGGGVGGLLINFLKNGTVARLVAGIESFKNAMPEAEEKLHESLRGKMKEADKKLVKKLVKKLKKPL